MDEIETGKLKDSLIGKIEAMYEADPKNFFMSFNITHQSGSFWCIITNNKYRQKNLEQVMGFD
jgi:hypothetical protein